MFRDFFVHQNTCERRKKRIKLIFIILIILVAVHDWRYRTIPNIYPSLILLLALQRPISIVGALGVSIPMLLLAMTRPGSIGGGDIKLVFAGGAFLGIDGIIKSVVAAILICGVYCVWLVFIKKKSRKTKIAFGPFLSIGMIYAML